MLAAAGIGLAQNAANGIMQGVFNTAQRRNQLQDYQMQRRDALSDRLHDEQYNSPAAMANRLGVAGFSPHLMNGQGVVASTPAVRQSSIANAPQSYQVNTSTNTLAMAQGLEQLKLLKANREKVEAETDSVLLENNANTQASGYDNSVINKKRQLEVEQIMSLLSKNALEGQKTAQDTANAEAAHTGIAANSAIAEIEKIFRAEQLQGKSDIQQQQIKEYLLKNHRAEIENKYVNKNERNKSAILEDDAKLRQMEAHMMDTLPPQVRYFVEKMGGTAFATILLRALIHR